MSRDDGYSIISVNAEDEIVIHAGIAPEADKEPEEREPEEAEPAAKAVEERAAESSPLPAAGKKDRYEETTIEDLDNTKPMSKMQKIILACALVFLVGFGLYYVFIFSAAG